MKVMGVPALSGSQKKEALEGQAALPLRVDPGAGSAQWRWAREKTVQCCLSSHMFTGLQVLVRDQTPSPASVGTRVDMGPARTSPKKATLESRPPWGDQGCQSHGKQDAATSDNHRHHTISPNSFPDQRMKSEAQRSALACKWF